MLDFTSHIGLFVLSVTSTRLGIPCGSPGVLSEISAKSSIESHRDLQRQILLFLHHHATRQGGTKYSKR